nr:helix-turn-helix domain-containing protein [Heyndrickxia coagulans]
MLDRLKTRYPNACIADEPIAAKPLLWFWMEEEKQYFGIDPGELTPEETMLLKTLFPKFRENAPGTAGEASKWYDYLFLLDAEAPARGGVYRVTQFALAKEGPDVSGVQEAIKNMFVHDVLVMMTNQLEGMVIEEKSGTAAAEDDLEASIRAFEGDFYTPVLLYLGEFKEVATLKRSFQFERRLFEFAKSRRKTSALFTAHALLPLYLLSHLPEGEKGLLFQSLRRLFEEDREMGQTIKRYLENFANASLTAKQLFIHRNSLQYRIEKFEEKTGLDLKHFTDAIFAYFVCLETFDGNPRR